MHTLLLSLCLPLLACSCGHSARQTSLTQTQVHEQTIAAHSAQAPNRDVAFLRDSVIYTKADSSKVVSLLKETPQGSDVIFYARRFIGIPYVASTLEVADPERLVVNLRQLDCTTLVETVLALTMTKRQCATDFSTYCRNLMLLRYRNGQMNGYLSRLHYFTWWMHDNIDMGLVREVSDTKHFTSPMIVNNYYMSAHPASYKFLKAHPEWADSIAQMEKEHAGRDGYYLTEAQKKLGRSALSVIQDGDIVAIVTKKLGIDYSHLGFAVWGKDGKLHLLNASSIHHKVVEEPKTLFQYLKEHPSSIGIRLLRLCN